MLGAAAQAQEAFNGSSHRLAFLHGGGQGSWVWKETIAALHRQTDGAFGWALALDIPGCALKRDRDTTTITTNEVVDELLDDITAAGLSDVVLVGHSQAGTILPLLIERRPALFRHIVYVSCAAPLPGQTIIQMIGPGTQGSNPDEVGWPVDPETHSFEERWRAMFCNDLDETQTCAFLSRLGVDSWPDLVTFDTEWRYDHLDEKSSTYVICLRDNILTADWQEKFSARFKVGHRVRIDAGHQVMNSRPHSLAEVLRMEAAR